MARISLQEQYDNKDVIHQIYGLKETVADAMGQIETAVTTANEASTTALSMGGRLTTVEGSINGINTKADNAVTVANEATTTVENMEARLLVVERSASESAEKADVADKSVPRGVTVMKEGTDGFSITLSKLNGELNSNIFNLGKVRSAAIKDGTALNSIYLELTLTDGTVVRSPDAVISISGVEADIHVTGLTLHETPDSHGIYGVFTLNDGSTVTSNTVTYDSPDIATGNTPGLVKSGSADGSVSVASDGVMTVLGFDSLKNRISAVESKASQNDANITVITGTTIPAIQNNVSSLTTRMTDVEEVNTNQNERLATIESDITTKYSTLENAISSEASARETKDNQIMTELGSESITGSVKSNIVTLLSDVNSLKETAGTVSGISTRMDTAEANISANTTAIERNNQAILNNTNNITQNTTDIAQNTADITSALTIANRAENATTTISNKVDEFDRKINPVRVGNKVFTSGVTTWTLTDESFNPLANRIVTFVLSPNLPSFVVDIVHDAEASTVTFTIPAVIGATDRMTIIVDSIETSLEAGVRVEDYHSTSLSSTDPKSACTYSVSLMAYSASHYKVFVTSASSYYDSAFSVTNSETLEANTVCPDIASEWPYQMKLGPSGYNFAIGTFDVALNCVAAASGNYSPFGMVGSDGVSAYIFSKTNTGPGDYNVVYHQRGVI